MDLEHSFIIPVPPEQAWQALLDVEQVAPCMPGATVDAFDGEVISGKIKVKVGPVQMTYAGSARFTERDEATKTVVLEASGKETRGSGTASATVRSSLQDEAGQTRVLVRTTMTVTGRPAQFGRGVMADVSDKIVGQFSSCLAKKLGPGAAKADEAAPAAEAADKSASAGTSAAAGSATAAASAGKAPEVGSAGVATATATPASATSTNGSGPKLAAAPEPTRSEVDAIDLLDTAGAPVLKRLAPVVLGLIALFIIFRVIKGRKS